MLRSKIERTNSVQFLSTKHTNTLIFGTCAETFAYHKEFHPVMRADFFSIIMNSCLWLSKRILHLRHNCACTPTRANHKVCLRKTTFHFRCDSILFFFVIVSFIIVLFGITNTRRKYISQMHCIFTILVWFFFVPS